MTLNDLQQRLAEFAAARDWQRFHTPKNLVMALSGEVGEPTALFQWLTPGESLAVLEDPARKAEVLDELADVTIYLARLADVLGVDLLAAAAAKVNHNESRFPVDRFE